eukprot:1339086-Amphidinium_carterae.2
MQPSGSPQATCTASLTAPTTGIPSPEPVNAVGAKRWASSDQLQVEHLSKVCRPDPNNLHLLEELPKVKDSKLSAIGGSSLNSPTPHLSAPLAFPAGQFLITPASVLALQALGSSVTTLLSQNEPGYQSLLQASS